MAECCGSRPGKSSCIDLMSLVGSFGDSTRDAARTIDFFGARHWGHLANMNMFQTSLGGECDNAIGDACAASDTHQLGQMWRRLQRNRSEFIMAHFLMHEGRRRPPKRHRMGCEVGGNLGRWREITTAHQEQPHLVACCGFHPVRSNIHKLCLLGRSSGDSTWSAKAHRRLKRPEDWQGPSCRTSFFANRLGTT